MLRNLVLGGALFVAWVSGCGAKKGDEFASCKPGEGYCACRSDDTCSDGFVCNQRHQCIRDDGTAGAQDDAGKGTGASGGTGSGGKAGSGNGGKAGSGDSGSKATGGSKGHRGGSAGKGEKGGTSGGGDAGTGEPMPATGGSSLGGTGTDTGAGGAGEAGQAGASGAGQGGETGSGGTLGSAGTTSGGGMSGLGGLGGIAGTTSAGAGGESGRTNDCIEITRGEVAFTDLGNAPDAAIYAFHADAVHKKQPLGDADTVDYLEVQFYASTFNPIDNGEATGSFELGTGIDANFETCARCLLIDEDVPGQGKPKALYFATEGTMMVADTSAQMTGAPNLTLSKVTFREVLIDDVTNESTLVPDGRCVYLESAALD